MNNLYLPLGRLFLSPVPMPSGSTPSERPGEPPPLGPYVVRFEREDVRPDKLVGTPKWADITPRTKLEWHDHPQGPSGHFFLSEDLCANRGIPKDASAVVLAVKTTVRTDTGSPYICEGTCAIALRTAGTFGGDYVTYASASKPSGFGRDTPGLQMTPRQEVFQTVVVMLSPDGRFELQCDIGITSNVLIVIVVRVLGYFDKVA